MWRRSSGIKIVMSGMTQSVTHVLSNIDNGIVNWEMQKKDNYLLYFSIGTMTNK